MREMIDSEYRVIHRVVKIPFEFDNEIYALNSSKPSLKSRKKKKEKKKEEERKNKLSVQREIIVKVLDSTFLPWPTRNSYFQRSVAGSSQQVRDGPLMNPEVHCERSECNGES